MLIQYKVDEQTLRVITTDSIPRKGSADYLNLQFEFSQDWDGTTKTLFISDGQENMDPIIVENNIPVLVPDYYSTQQYIYITLVGISGDKRIPTNVVSLRLNESNDTWEHFAPDVESPLYQQLIDMVQKAIDGARAPYINKDTLTWMEWDPERGVFVDTGVVAVGEGRAPDTAMSDSSENTVQNKVIKEYVDAALTGKANSGDVSSLSKKVDGVSNMANLNNKDIKDLKTGKADRSEIPKDISDLNNDSGFIDDSSLVDYAKKSELPTKTSQLTNDSDFATNVSVDEKIANIPEGSKDYNDLTNKPRINDIELKGNLTADELGIQGGGSDIKQFDIVLESAKWVETNYTFSDTRFKVDGFTYDIYVKPADYEKYGIEAKDITVDNEISFLSTSKPLEDVTITVIAYQMNVVPVGELEDLTIKVDGVAKVYNGTTPTEIDITTKQLENYPTSAEVELTKEIKPNVFYRWGEVATLNITFAPETEGIVNDYHFSFKSGLAPTQLTLPETVKWVSQPNIEASKTYEVSIVDNLGVICGA